MCITIYRQQWKSLYRNNSSILCFCLLKMLLTFHIFYILWKNSLSTTIKKQNINVLLIFTLCKAIENGNLLALMFDSTALDSLYFIIWSDSISKTLYQPLLYNILLLPRLNKLWRVKRVSQAAPSSLNSSEWFLHHLIQMSVSLHTGQWPH